MALDSVSREARAPTETTSRNDLRKRPARGHNHPGQAFGKETEGWSQATDRKLRHVNFLLVYPSLSVYTDWEFRAEFKEIR
jgi:hypothetical protein